MTRHLAWIAVASCGSDQGIPPDAVDVAPGTPVVTVSSPRANDAFLTTATANIAWTASDDGALACDVAAVGELGTVAIAGAVAVQPGLQASVAWPLGGVSPDSYRVRVTCTDVTGLAGDGTSAPFVVSDAAQPISFATQIAPMLAASCTSGACHDASSPEMDLSLISGSAYGELVGVASSECYPTLLVAPGAPADSYLVAKLRGGGCGTGVRMPKNAPAWSEAQIALVTAWIADGAPNN